MQLLAAVNLSEGAIPEDQHLLLIDILLDSHRLEDEFDECLLVRVYHNDDDDIFFILNLLFSNELHKL